MFTSIIVSLSSISSKSVTKPFVLSSYSKKKGVGTPLPYYQSNSSTLTPLYSDGK